MTATVPAVQVGGESATSPGEIVHLMVRYLAGKCDGAHLPDNQGFNRLHARFGREIADLPIEAISPRQLWAARKMLTTYKNTQLKNFWDFIPEIPEPPKTAAQLAQDRNFVDWRRKRQPDYVPEPRLRRMRLVEYAGDQYIELQHNADAYELIDKIKELPDRHYDKYERRWLVPLRLESLSGLSEFVAEEGYDVDDAVSGAINTAVDNISHRIGLSQAVEMEGMAVELPAGLHLYPFQEVGVQYIKHVKNPLVADQMGLGKTVETLIGVRELTGWPLVVVCPASLKANWRNECKKWCPDKTVAVLDSKLVAPLNWPDGKPAFDIVILNYDILKKWKEHIVTLFSTRPTEHDRAMYGTLVVDECHNIKNMEAQRTQHIASIISDCPNSNRIFVSGSPVVNRPMEFWTMIKLLGHSSVMGGYANYKMRYDNNYRDRLEELNAKARANFMLRRLKRDVLKDLPDKQSTIVELPLTNRAEYDEAEGNIAKYFAQKKVEKVELDALQLRLLIEAAQAGLSGDVAMEFVKDEIERETGQVYHAALSMAQRSEQLLRWEALKQVAVKGKMKAAFEWIDEFLEGEEKLVVFAVHTEIVEAVAKRYNAPYIHGGIPPMRRQLLVDRFQQDPDCRVIVGNLRAMGEGLTLTAASDVAFLEFGWNPKTKIKPKTAATGSVKKDSVMVWNLAAEQTIDFELAELIESKRQVTEAIQDGAGEAKQMEMMDALRDRLLAKRVG